MRKSIRPLDIQVFLTCLFGLTLIMLSLFIDQFSMEIDNRNFAFGLLMSFGIGMLTIMLTGTITGGGEFGLFNIKSVSGGAAIFLIVFGVYYGSYLRIRQGIEVHSNKFFRLSESIGLIFDNCYFSNKLDSRIPIEPDQLYSIIDEISLLEDGSVRIKIRLDKFHFEKFTSIKLNFLNSSVFTTPLIGYKGVWNRTLISSNRYEYTYKIDSTKSKHTELILNHIKDKSTSL